jgi:hypothetical protein
MYMTTSTLHIHLVTKVSVTVFLEEPQAGPYWRENSSRNINGFSKIQSTLLSRVGSNKFFERADQSHLPRFSSVGVRGDEMRSEIISKFEIRNLIRSRV